MKRLLQSIPAKICVCLFSLLVILLSTTGFFYLKKCFTEIDKATITRLTLPGIMMSQGVLKHEEVRNFVTLSNITQETILDAFFISNDGRVLHSADVAREGKMYLDYLGDKGTKFFPGNLSTNHHTNFLTSYGKNHIMTITPVWSDNRFAGSLYLRVDAQSTQSQKANNLYSYLGWSILTILLTTFVGGMAVHFFVVSRVQQTSDILQKVTDGSLSQRIGQKGVSDQLGKLNVQINSMIETTENNTKFLRETIEKLHMEMNKSRDAQLQLIHAEKLSALGRLSASIVHEFGNPLLGVRFMLEDINRRLDLDLEDQQLIFLGLEECDRMKALLQSLRNLNKPSSEIMTSFNIEQSIDNILTFQEKYFKSNKIILERKYNLFFPEIIAIEDQITQVLINMIINAASAIPDEGGSISITTETVDSNKISIEISDTGVGISDENQNKIFEPFFSTKTDGEGTGLGLTVSYGIIQNHGGSISFESEKDKGTSFLITIPTGYECV